MYFLFLSLSVTHTHTQINGNLTLGENIADNGGVKTAFKAYQNVIANESPQMLPAIDLTPEQLFFVAFGQVYSSLSLLFCLFIQLLSLGVVFNLYSRVYSI